MIRKILLGHFILTLNLMAFGQQSLEDSILIKMMTTDVERFDDERFRYPDTLFFGIILNEDTIAAAYLKNVNISSPRIFSNHDDRKKYIIYRRYASSVFPYAQEAVRIYKEAQEATVNLNKRKRKKHHRKLAKKLRKEFEASLKKLSKNQGKMMIKMIERELDMSMYSMIKSTNGWWRAFYWNNLSKIFGYKLKRRYREGDDAILDIVLMDFDISPKS